MKTSMMQVFTGWLVKESVQHRKPEVKTNGVVTTAETTTVDQTKINEKAAQFLKGLRKDIDVQLGFTIPDVVCGHGRDLGERPFTTATTNDYEFCRNGYESVDACSVLKLWFAGLGAVWKQQEALKKIVEYDAPSWETEKPFPTETDHGVEAQKLWCEEQEYLFVAGAFTRKELWDAAEGRLTDSTAVPKCREKLKEEAETAGWIVLVIGVLAGLSAGVGGFIAHFGGVVLFDRDPCLEKFFCVTRKDDASGPKTDKIVVDAGNGASAKVNEMPSNLNVRQVAAPADASVVASADSSAASADSSAASAESSSVRAVNDAVTEGKIQSSTMWSTPLSFIGSPSDGQVSSPDEEPMAFSSMLLISGGVVCTLVLFAVVLRRRRRSRGSARSRQRGSLVVVGKRRGKFHDIL